MKAERIHRRTLKTMVERKPGKVNEIALKVNEMIGVDLPDDTINSIVTGVKAKLNLDKLGGLFGKK